MPRGGARVGAGRPRKVAVTPRARPLPADIKQPAADAGMSPLDYMLAVMRDADEDPARRDRMAVAAAPYLHVRAVEVAGGKKEAQQERAREVATKFAPSAPPRLVISR